MPTRLEKKRKDRSVSATPSTPSQLASSVSPEPRNRRREPTQQEAEKRQKARDVAAPAPTPKQARPTKPVALRSEQPKVDRAKAEVGPARPESGPVNSPGSDHGSSAKTSQPTLSFRSALPVNIHGSDRIRSEADRSYSLWLGRGKAVAEVNIHGSDRIR